MIKRMGVLLIVATCFMILPSTKALSQDQKIIKVHGQMPASHFMSKAVEMIIKDSEINSKGSLKFQYYPAQQLFKDSQIQDVLPTGAVDIAMIDFYKLTGKVPTGYLTTPCFVDMDWYFRWFYDINSGGGFYYKVLQPAYAKRNMYLLGTINYTPSTGVLSTKPITKISDYSGLKIRVGGKSMGALIEALGGKAAVLSSSDVYMALQRKTVDGSFTAPSSISSRKWYEIAKYYHDLGTGNMPLGIAANLDFWKKLTEKQRTIIKDAMRKAEQWCMDESINDDNASIEIMKNGNVTINQLPKDDMDNMAKIGLSAVKENVLRDVGENNWNIAMELRKNTREGKAKARELVQSRMFPE